MLSLSFATFLARGDQVARLSIGTMYDPNDLAMVIVTILPIAMMYGFHSKGTERLFGIGASIIGIIVITLTQSRGGFIGLITIAFLIFFSKSRFKIKYLIILLLLGVMFVRFAPTEYMDRIGTITGEDDGGSGRTLVWKRSLRMISSNPFGYGVNNFQSAYGRYVENDPNAEEASGGYMTYSWKTAHNSFILVAVELGVLGLAVYVYLIYKAYNNFKRIKKTFTSGTILYQYAEFLKISLVGFLACAFFLSQSYSSMLFLLVAISSVMVNVIAKETEGV
jgi:O-antigen ligase